MMKIVAIRSHILRSYYSKFDFGWGSASDPTGPAWGAHSAPQALYSWVLGVLYLSRGREERPKGRGKGKGRELGKGRKGGEDGEGGRGREWKGKTIWICSPGKISYTPLVTIPYVRVIRQKLSKPARS